MQVVGTGSEDASSILFDLRSHGPLNKFSDDSVMLGIFSVCFSKSGRLMFAGYEERMCYAWETISSEGCVPFLPRLLRLPARLVHLCVQ